MASAILKYQASAFPGSLVMNGCMCAFAPYNIENQRTFGYDVVSNRPKAAAYRAPISAFAVESTLDIVAKTIGMDPAELRMKNAASIGTHTQMGSAGATRARPRQGRRSADVRSTALRSSAVGVTRSRTPPRSGERLLAGLQSLNIGTLGVAGVGRWR